VDESAPVVNDPARGAAYAYELRRGEEVVSTGRLMADDELAIGEQLMIAGILARVEEVTWLEGDLRLLLQPALGLTAA
jgi:hypothetical protein